MTVRLPPQEARLVAVVGMAGITRYISSPLEAPPKADGREENRPNEIQ